MKIKVVLAVTDRAVEYTVDARSVPAMERFFAHSGIVPPPESGWILCESDRGWPTRLNLAQCVTVEQAAD